MDFVKKAINRKNNQEYTFCRFEDTAECITAMSDWLEKYNIDILTISYKNLKHVTGKFVDNGRTVVFDEGDYIVQGLGFHFHMYTEKEFFEEFYIV